MNHGHGKAVNEFLFAMLKMILDAYLQSMMPCSEVDCAPWNCLADAQHLILGKTPTRPAPVLRS